MLYFPVPWTVYLFTSLKGTSTYFYMDCLPMMYNFNTMIKLIFRIILLLWKILVCRNFRNILELKLQKFNQDTLIIIFTLGKSITAKSDFHCFKGLQTAFQLHWGVSKRALKMPKNWYKITLILNYGLRCYILDKDYKGSAFSEKEGEKARKSTGLLVFDFFLFFFLFQGMSKII